MKINGLTLQKVEALVATGMPGAHRVLTFFLIKSIYGENGLGEVASLFSIAQIIGFFTAIGWSALVLVRVARAENQHERIDALTKLTLMSLVTLLFCCALVLSFGFFYQRAEQSIGVCYLLIGWTLYQIPRHYLIALLRYRSAVLLDVIILMLTILGLFLTNEKNIALTLSLPMIVCGLLSFLILQKGGKIFRTGYKYEIKGLEFGLANFLSGGISLSLIPLAKYFEGADFAGVLALFISVSAISMLLPRAIALNQLSAIAKNLNNKDQLKIVLGNLEYQLLASNLIASIFSIGVAGYFLFTLPGQVVFFSTLVAMLLVIAQSFISAQSLVGSNIFMAMEKSRALLSISMVVTSLFAIFSLILFEINIKNSFLWLCFVMILLNFFRMLFIKRRASNLVF